MYSSITKLCMLAILFISPVGLFAANYETVTFDSKDGLPITADIYKEHSNSAPFILLFHQARSSRGEYREIAPQLSNQGFNVMAVDLRAGGTMKEVENETWRAAVKAGKGTRFSDAYQDMEAALNYAIENFASGEVLAWGSSYTASLSIILAAQYPNQIDGVLAFSPGEYFGKVGEYENFVKGYASKIQDPVFITSKRSEADDVREIYNAVPVDRKRLYTPMSEGYHGSQALWPERTGSDAYWLATREFLNDLTTEHQLTAANNKSEGQTGALSVSGIVTLR